MTCLAHLNTGKLVELLATAHAAEVYAHGAGKKPPAPGLVEEVETELARRGLLDVVVTALDALD